MAFHGTLTLSSRGSPSSVFITTSQTFPLGSFGQGIFPFAVQNSHSSSDKRQILSLERSAFSLVAGFGKVHLDSWKGYTRGDKLRTNSFSRKKTFCVFAKQDKNELEKRTAHLCLFPVTFPCLPTAKGALHLYEPRYLHLLDVIRAVAESTKTAPQFGCLQRDLIDEGEKRPFSPIGCCCVVEREERFADGSVSVEHMGGRRFRLLNVQRWEPFLVANVEWVEDSLPDQAGSSSGARIDRLERELWEACLEVARLTASLDARKVTYFTPEAVHQRLPLNLRRFSPQPPVTAAATSITRLGMADIQVWRRSSLKQRDPQATDLASNPYWAARETIAKPARQEAFSFAAASMVDLGPEEQQSLLQLLDTGARLAWVLEAVTPHRASLRAKHSLLRATEKQ